MSALTLQEKDSKCELWCILIQLLAQDNAAMAMAPGHVNRAGLLQEEERDLETNRWLSYFRQ
jgi:hypothetical protein